MIKRSIAKTTDPYGELRQKLLSRGYTFRSFALAFGYSIQTVYCAARGTRSGKISKPIRKHLESFTHVARA